MKRTINYIVVHCTATAHNTKVENILKYWKKIGWKNVGYHYLIEANGKVNQLAEESQITNGVKGYNSQSIHVSYIGGKSEDDRTEKQKDSLKIIVRQLKDKYPNAKVQGHRDFLTKGKSGWKNCPQFNAIEEYNNI
jgi:N-acetylmuramoyl-L-alanine amidase